ncbi:amidohydrolase family protein [Azospirillum canadense]|uniref:amidohydrolase family protein n=1 Tax=Azospirillum canadense TaxID=403962 RepID=UPI002227C485|nr:amidohydrolase family protein [Azospirillum canadense]MCW2241707.1 putative TIM-barrel fold metal-dependent hydrolase [Azospirillum canadense]
MTQTKSGAPTAILPSADPNWLALREEAILEPDLPIIDPHHHLWGPPRTRYLAEELQRDAQSGHNVIATIFTDCTEGYRSDGPENMRPVGETEFATAIADQCEAGVYQPAGLCAGIISYADLREGESVRAVLEAHIAAGKGRFKGIRQSTSWDPNPEVRTTMRTPPEKLLRDPQLRRGFACLAPLGLTFDAWVYHHQLSDVADLAAAFPETAIVLDHVGGPIGIGPYAGRRDEVFAQWKAGILEIARHPNVTVKLGGLAMRLGGFGFHERPVPPSSEELAAAWRPYIETCIEAFGPDRAMFESNFPVDQLSCSYAILWNGFKRLAAGCSNDEKAALFSRTAARVYSLEHVLH